ncbi:hypothetical protein [Actinoallomurus sp. NPDC052274]|uniref:hypothetical protein n=1 Tax=Actinoallomurus sp. NPDC052274 TaxID=3155420 RepID=UPI00342A1C9C
MTVPIRLDRYRTPCGHWSDAADRHCGRTPTRHYPVGHRCQAHTPSALAGEPEPGTRPARPRAGPTPGE